MSALLPAGKVTRQRAFNKMLYFGFSCFISEFSKIKASFSLSTTIYLKSTASLIILKILGDKFGLGCRVGVNLQ
jgi:hypothetical protein